MNKAILIGRVATEPELRRTADGTAVCSFRLAVDREYKNQQTGKKDADFLNIVTWRQLAELCGKWLKKGKQCAVEGKIRVRSYEKDGARNYITEIVADGVQFLSPVEKPSEGLYPVPTGGDEFAGMTEDTDIPF